MPDHFHECRLEADASAGVMNMEQTNPKVMRIMARQKQVKKGQMGTVQIR